MGGTLHGRSGNKYILCSKTEQGHSGVSLTLNQPNCLGEWARHRRANRLTRGELTHNQTQAVGWGRSRRQEESWPDIWEPGFEGLVAAVMSSKPVQLEGIRLWTGGWSPVTGFWPWAVWWVLICGMEDLADGSQKATTVGQEARPTEVSCTA